jgi:NDP-hexose 4-ketoreductase
VRPSAWSGERRPGPAFDPLAGGSVVVLGATGFLGRHLCAALGAAGARVTTVSRSAPDTSGGARQCSVSMDLTKAGVERLARLCAETEADVLVNASGAVWGGTERQMTEINAELVGRLVEAVTGSARRPRLIQLGSAYEYGPTGHGSVTGEDCPPAPATVYGRTKLLGSQAVLRGAEKGVDGVVLRVSVACGPGTPRTSLPGIVAGHLAAGRAELRLAPLRAHRDFVDVRDVAGAVLAAARAPAAALAGRIVNIGSGQAVPVRGLVDLMISLSGRPIHVVEESPAQLTRSDAPWQRLDISRARRLLGWSPRRTLEESLRDLLTAVGALDPRPRERGARQRTDGAPVAGRAPVPTVKPKGRTGDE